MRSEVGDSPTSRDIDMRMKLHPISVPYRILQSAPGLFGLLVLAAIGAEQFQAGLLVLVATLALIIGSIAVILWQVAYYRRFAYEVTLDTFDIRSGVISRRHREIPYRRVQNVDISRTMIQRMLGIAELRIETAGGAQSEAHLRYVGYDEAKRLQEQIREITRGVDRAVDTAPDEDAHEELYRITERDLGVLAVASFDLRVASFLAVILSVMAPSVIIGMLLAAPIDPVAIIAAIGLVVVILSAILSGGSAIINNYGFTLTRVGDELRYERGLLQRYDGSIPLEKVQSVVVTENLLMRWFGYASLTVETAGYGPGAGAESAQAVPISRRERTVSIAQEIERFDPSRFSRPAKRARIRYTIRYLVLAFLLVGAAYALTWWSGADVAWWVTGVGVLLAPLAAHLKWSHRGYALVDGYALLRAGFWRRRTHIVPYYRIQTVDEVQTIIQRRWRIATVVIDTAGSSGLVAGNPTAYDIDEREATQLRDSLSAELQRSLDVRRRERWMRTHLRPSRFEGIRGTW